MALTRSPFGHALRQDFLFDPKWVNLNHGSFGSIVRPVRDALRGFQDRMEAVPDAYFRYEYPALLDDARGEIAALLRVPIDDVVFVPNATTAMNTVFRNLIFERGDVIVYFSTIYAGCEKTVLYICETTPAEARRIEVTYPVSDAYLVDRMMATIRAVRAEGKRPRIAVFDTVSSQPGVRMPFERLTRACRDEGVLSCIDAAHAVGMLDPDADLKLAELDPDFFFSNCHKWLFAPRGCAVFYVPARNQGLIRSSLPTSHGFQPLPTPGAPPISNPLPTGGQSAFAELFAFVATIDASPYACVPAAIKYRRERLGGEREISRYLMALARKGGEIVTAKLGTRVMENEQGTLGKCAFANVALPLDARSLLDLVPGRPAEDEAALAALANRVMQWIQRVIVKDHDTFIALNWHGGEWWVRLSAQVYLEEADFERAGDILKEMCRRVEKGEFLDGAAKL